MTEYSDLSVIAYARGGINASDEPIVEGLWRLWCEKYPDLEFTKHMINDIEKHFTCGHFHVYLAMGDVGQAFNYADAQNVHLLEKLVGMTKKEYGRKYWGWPADSMSGSVTEE
jgi:hypothetical protein